MASKDSEPPEFSKFYEKMKAEPIKFHPYLKSVIWGGDKICKFKGIEQPEPKIGESWEISSVPGHESVVAEGVYEGKKITELIDEFGEKFLGEKVFKKFEGKFPLLIKFIDANDNLSVQVHPDDALAKERHGSMGKTEMWYIIHSEKGAKIYSGLNRTITPEEYEESVKEDRFQYLIAEHTSNPGDVFFLPAGRVHAIGSGNLLAEIQQSSDITYRIYDYNRKDADGNPRELHTSLAKDAIDYQYHDDYKMAPLPEDDKDCKIISCDHFTTRRIIIDEEGKNIELDHSSFVILICLKGRLTVFYPNGETELSEGNTLLLPAVMDHVSLKGDAILLTAQV